MQNTPIVDLFSYIRGCFVYCPFLQDQFRQDAGLSFGQKSKKTFTIGKGLFGAEGGTWTRMGDTRLILSQVRLPFRHFG